MAEAASALGVDVVCGGEAPLPGRLGRPDFAVLRSGLLAGYVALKAPGKGADSRRFRSRDRAQFKRFSAVPNMLYGDGCEWALYRGGARAGGVARFSGDPVSEGGAAVSAADAQAFADLLRDFLLWDPVLPLDGRGRMDLEAFAAVLAPLCRMLREDVVDALGAGAPRAGSAGGGMAAIVVSQSDRRAIRRFLRADGGVRAAARPHRGRGPADAGRRAGRAGGAPQPVVAGVAGPHRPPGARRAFRLARSPLARHRRDAARRARGAARPVAVFLRGLPRRLRSQTAQGRRGVLHAGRSGAGAGAAGGRVAVGPARPAGGVRRPRSRDAGPGGRDGNLSPRRNRARFGAGGGGAGRRRGRRAGGGTGAAALRLRIPRRPLCGGRIAGEPRAGRPGGGASRRRGADVPHRYAGKPACRTAAMAAPPTTYRRAARQGAGGQKRGSGARLPRQPAPTTATRRRRPAMATGPGRGCVTATAKAETPSSGTSSLRSSPPARAGRRRTSTTSTSISGAGRCGKCSSTRRRAAPAWYVSSPRRVTSTATPSSVCASTCGASATKCGYSISAARDGARGGARTFSPSARRWPSPWRCGPGRVAHPRRRGCATRGSRERGRRSCERWTASTVSTLWNGPSARRGGARRSARRGAGRISPGPCWPTSCRGGIRGCSSSGRGR